MWRACLLAALAVGVSGCVGMPQAGQVGADSNKQAGTEQNPASQIGLFPSGPLPGASPTQIVSEFLTASASYPTHAPIVQEYLAGSAKDWKPGWSVTVLQNKNVTDGQVLRPRHGPELALVDVSGPVQATLNGTNQYVLASAQGTIPRQAYQFILVKVGGQWRISNPPPTYRLVAAADFPQVYQAQDLYFFDDSTGVQTPMLVPDPVFVPKGTSPALLVSHLVTALAQGPSATWLQGAANSAFPAGTKIMGVSVSATTATVNLRFSATPAPTPTLERISAELLWTLAGPTASVPNIQSVELELDGRAWTLPSSPCGTGQAQTVFQKLASYECYDPYPSVPASFSFVSAGVAAGQPWSRCGSESEAQAAEEIGSVVSVFGRTGSDSSHQCGGYVDPLTPAPFPRAVPTSALSMVAVSPSGQYVAGVSLARDTLYVGPVSGTAASFSTSQRLKNAPGLTSLSWDRDNDLWAAQGDNIWVVPGPGAGRYQAVNEFGPPAPIAGLAVAPDGVRMAVIVQNGSANELELAAIERSASQHIRGARGAPGLQYTVLPGVQLGQNLIDPISLTWYNADTLIVLDAESTGNYLYSVPIDGEPATELQVTQQGTVSITADGPANILVAGLSGGGLAFSLSTAGPWKNLRDGGLSPAYP